MLELGSRLKLLKVSNTILLLCESSPLLIKSENVPLLLSLLVISHLTFSADPETNELSEFSGPGIAADVPLL